MHKFVGRLALAAAITAAPLATASAEGSKIWNVCGGNAFALCASVTVTVSTVGDKHIVEMKIYNLSGTYDTYAGTVFTSIGLEEVVPATVELLDGSLKVTGPCAEASGTCDYSEFWTVYNDKSIGGGIKVDLLSGSFNSQYSIASTCLGATPPEHGLYFLTSCAYDGPDFVSLSFEVSEDFDPNTGYLFIKGQAGPDGDLSTQCLTGGSSENCSVVPEPVTLLLFGSGLGGMSLLGGVRSLRRRRKGLESLE